MFTARIFNLCQMDECLTILMLFRQSRSKPTAISCFQSTKKQKYFKGASHIHVTTFRNVIGAMIELIEIPHWQWNISLDPLSIKSIKINHLMTLMIFYVDDWTLMIFFRYFPVNSLSPWHCFKIDFLHSTFSLFGILFFYVFCQWLPDNGSPKVIEGAELKSYARFQLANYHN